MKFVITGFSSFPGVAANPTEVLVKWLGERVGDNPIPNCSIEVCEVLEVTGKVVVAKLDEFRAKLGLSTGKAAKTTTGSPEVSLSMPEVMFVHFGVDSTAGDNMALESEGYNEADFRSPDMGGWTASHEVIDAEEGGLEVVEKVPLPCDALAARLVEETGLKTVVSTDAGRYICNYTLYQSLLRSRGVPSEASIFIHVPSFEKIPEEAQKGFVVAALKNIADPSLWTAAPAFAPEAPSQDEPALSPTPSV